MAGSGLVKYSKYTPLAATMFHLRRKLNDDTYVYIYVLLRSIRDENLASEYKVKAIYDQTLHHRHNGAYLVYAPDKTYSRAAHEQNV